MDLSDPLSAVIPGVNGRVLLVLARAGMPLTGLTVAQLAHASPEGVRKVLVRLRAHGIVLSRVAGASVLYEANRRHLLWSAVDGLVREADQAVSTVKRMISERIEIDVPAADVDQVTAALYGSVARGEARLDSDVDVLLVVPDHVPDHLLDHLESAIITEVLAATGNDCSVYAMRRTRFDELVRTGDPMIPSWDADAAVFHGPDFRRRLRGGAWDGR